MEENMKLQSDVGNVKITLEFDEEEFLREMAPAQRALAQKMLRHELNTLVLGQAHLVMATLCMGPLTGIMFELIRSKMKEASNAALQYITAVQNGQDPKELVFKHYLNKIQDNEINNGPFPDFIDGLDLPDDK